MGTVRALGFEPNHEAVAWCIGAPTSEVAKTVLPLCEDCVDNIGGAGAGPDAIWRPAAEGEACGAADCVQDIVIEYNLTEGA